MAVRQKAKKSDLKFGNQHPPHKFQTVFRLAWLTSIHRITQKFRIFDKKKKWQELRRSTQNLGARDQSIGF